MYYKKDSKEIYFIINIGELLYSFIKGNSKVTIYYKINGNNIQRITINSNKNEEIKSETINHLIETINKEELVTSVHEKHIKHHAEKEEITFIDKIRNENIPINQHDLDTVSNELKLKENIRKS